MIKHTGEKLDVKIVKVSEFTISYTYPNETAEQTIGKYAVAKIEYASGRKEEHHRKGSYRRKRRLGESCDPRISYSICRFEKTRRGYRQNCWHAFLPHFR